MKPSPASTATTGASASPIASQTFSVKGASTATTGSAATSANVHRRAPGRPSAGRPATAKAPMHAARTGHCTLTAAIGYITVVTAASSVGTRREPTASSIGEHHLRSNARTAANSANANATMASTYQPSLWKEPACSAPTSG